MRSVEADIALFGDGDGFKADLVGGSIGKASTFHQSFGFYARGVSIETAILPEGWEDRLVRFESPATEGLVACAFHQTICGYRKRSGKGPEILNSARQF